MIARLDHLRTHPAVFRHLTGLTLAAFDQLAADLVPVLEQAHRAGRERPDRQRAVGGGDTFALTTADNLLLTVVGIAILAGSSRLLVDSAVTLAEFWGVPKLVIGLTIVAIGTSAPELVTSLVAELRGKGDLGIGNICL